MAYTEAELISLGAVRILALIYLGQQATGEGATRPTTTFGQVSTNLADFVALPSTPAKRVTITNGTGTLLQVKQTVGGAPLDLPVNAVMTFPTTANANEWTVSRKDAGAAVVVTFKAENW